MIGSPSAAALAIAVERAIGKDKLPAITVPEPPEPVDEKPYVFNERPVCRSSTGVLTSQGDNVACPSCGCRRGKLKKKDCKCSCHKGWNE